jgi:hypothetical protein
MCSNVVDFLKSSRTDPIIGLVLIAIGVEPEYRYVSRSLSGWGPKGEPNAPIADESEMTNLLRLLKLIWQPNMSMLAIGVESEYRSVTRSLSGWGPKGEHNAPIVIDSYRHWERGHRFLLWMKISCYLVRASCAPLIGLEYISFEVVAHFLWITQRTPVLEREP